MQKIRFSQLQQIKIIKDNLNVIMRKNIFLVPYYMICLLWFIYWLVYIIRYI
jgi:hypothetical protein